MKIQFAGQSQLGYWWYSKYTVTLKGKRGGQAKKQVTIIHPIYPQVLVSEDTVKAALAEADAKFGIGWQHITKEVLY